MKLQACLPHDTALLLATSAKWDRMRMAGGVVALSCAARPIDRQDRNLANLLAQKELFRTKSHLHCTV
jgi:hypothetical protein